jgi:hypothetical protein
MPSYEDRNRPKWIIAAKDMAKEAFRALVSLFVYYFDHVSRERYGVVQSLDVPNRRVVVRLLPNATTGGTPEMAEARAFYGRPTWTAGQIVGKRVRVWQTEHIILGKHGPELQDVVFVIDDVQEP